MTNEMLGEAKTLKKYYDTWSIFGWAYLGWPLVVTYFLAENFKTIWEPEKVKSTYIVWIVFTILLFVSLSLLPENILDAIPSYLIPTLYCAIAQWIFWAYQKKKIDELKNNGHSHNSTWKVLWVALIWLIITLIPIFKIQFSTFLFLRN